MAKQTDKLRKALEILRKEFNPSIPNHWTYAQAEQAGYTWNGQDWTRPERPYDLEYPVLLRLTGGHGDIDRLIDLIAQALRAGGYLVTVKASRPNSSDQYWRVYADIE